MSSAFLFYTFHVSRLFFLCISLVFDGKYMEFCIIFSFEYSISINTFEVAPPSDSLHNAIVKPKNWHEITKKEVISVTTVEVCG